MNKFLTLEGHFNYLFAEDSVKICSLVCPLSFVHLLAHEEVYFSSYQFRKPNNYRIITFSFVYCALTKKRWFDAIKAQF